MSKSNANRAIDFQRIFELKDKLASRSPQAEVPVAALEAPTAEAAVSASLVVETTGEGTVVDFPAPAAMPAPDPAPEVSPEAATPRAFGVAERVTELLPPPPPSLEASEALADAAGPLRVGMPRALHQRVRAAAAMACVPSVAFVRHLLQGAAPALDPGASLSVLGERARTAFPASEGARRSIDVRMQVPVGEELHRRLVQLAALRAQTLGACLVDALEHQLPR